MNRLELWAGPECTVNRVGDQFNDQVQGNGHHERSSDLDLLAGLGFSAIRYPVLWERIAPDDPAVRDWAWTDERLPRLREMGLRTIAGLVHHGSGPCYADIMSSDFASGLAEHAAAVIRRYPWIEDWTPVNEPVTTARFCALYGLWYPHLRNERAFWLALLNQIDATRLAMRAVRRVCASARLIQTDDLGRTYATAMMRDQAAFDNTRRWMGWDLLCGMVVPGHPLWRRLCDYGFEERLRAIADEPCPPDAIGINHYLTSDRFLDHRLQRYPGRTYGCNGRQSFADTEAVRVLDPPPAGLRGALREAWDRYHIPLVVTEVHNGCTREEQMRWTADAWAAAQQMRAEDVEVRAVTSWSLFGSHGWNTLLTGVGRYESGAFDVSGAEPRATALVGLLRALGRGEQHVHAALDGAGWWRRPIRLLHPPAPRPAPIKEHIASPQWRTPHHLPLMIVGATGTLGQAIASACRHRDIHHIITARTQLDLDSADHIEGVLDRYRPWALINAAGWVRVDEAETESEACFRANASGAIALAEACARRGIPTVGFSSDLVFDGKSGRPYHEEDEAAPLNVYGRSKYQAEQALLALPGSHLVVRTAAFFSPHDVHNFAIQAIESLSAGRRVRAAADHVVSPTFVPQLANAVLDLAIDGATGIWHLTNGDAVSWAEFAQRLARICGHCASNVELVQGSALGWVAARPAYVPLLSKRGSMMTSLDEALEHFSCLLREKRRELFADFTSAG